MSATAPAVTTKQVSFEAEVKDAEQGTFSAVFSTFNVIDSDGDVVKPGAIPDGVEVPVVWGHDWGMMPVGKGVIRTSKKHAVIDGQFNLATEAGKDAWNTLKFMGSAQQYSWGFEITEYSFGEFDGQSVRFITGTRPMEVSPVLVGANPQTGTLSVKSPCPTCGHKDSAGAVDEVAPGSDEQAAVDEVAEEDDWKERAILRIRRARLERNG